MSELKESDVKVTTVRSGQEYRAKIDKLSLGLLYDPDNEAVWIHTKTANLGGWNLSRFGGELKPASIRKFFVERFSTPENLRFNDLI